MRHSPSRPQNKRRRAEGMTITLKALQAKVLDQKTRIPSLYGDVDFSIVPERFSTNPQDRTMLPPKYARLHRKELLADHDRVERALAYTMLGDSVADAYAALMPQYGFRGLIGMLSRSCVYGVEKVPEAPKELVDFIRSMERRPAWLDMKLVEEGARYSRNQMAVMVPFAIRGAFIATFMNKYSGLPMALTGALSGQSTEQRVKETASFFTTATLPGALERFGTGFHAAAMVRLMHSMVRFNILKRSKAWDVAVHGIPIPQIDQMPAGTMPSFLMAYDVIRKGRKHFNRRERAVVELCRYQSYLLGLPEELLPDSPQGIYDVMVAYTGTLRDGYDDETCGELIRATMKAYLPEEKSLKNRIYNEFERSFSKVFFTRVFLQGGTRDKAGIMGIEPSLFDYAKFGAVSMYVMPQLIANRIVQEVPLLNRVLDYFLVDEINRLLVSYGHPEFATDGSKYKEEAMAKRKASAKAQARMPLPANPGSGAAHA
ncbi:Hypothetical protein HDN1F_24220 [gamma proteobacterium HdN1]|nr:Hypothetical protein HDN1F_24220 [gamma proteobacterium HdN1]